MPALPSPGSWGDVLRLAAERLAAPPVKRPWACSVPDCDGLLHEGYDYRHARASQRLPSGGWFSWLIVAGRGFGKTKTGAETVTKWMLDEPGIRVALVAPTFDAARDVMCEGESGLISTIPEELLFGGNWSKAFNATNGKLRLANGSQAQIYTSEKARRLRGPQHHKAWADEPAEFRDANKPLTEDTTWSNLAFGLRLGQNPQVIVTGTPKPFPVIKGLIADPTCHVTRGSTYENLANLAPTFRAQVVARYEGTRLGRQELNAEILEDVEGALWTSGNIGLTRVDAAPPLAMVVVAMDTAASTRESADDTGIVVAGKVNKSALALSQYYVLADRSCHEGPEGRCRRAVMAWSEFEASAIVYESDMGGDYIGEMLRSTAETMRREGLIRQIPRIKPVRARNRGSKVVRAEPIAALWEQGRGHMVGLHPELEDQLTRWVPDSGHPSPDRLDACVWAVAELDRTGSAGGMWVED